MRAATTATWTSDSGYMANSSGSGLPYVGGLQEGYESSSNTHCQLRRVDDHDDDLEFEDSSFARDGDQHR